MEPRLNVVTLAVSDLMKARKFYEVGLGWKVSPESQESIVFFQLGGVVLALYPRNLLAEDANVSPAGAGFQGVTLGHNVRERSDVTKILEDARAAGANILKPAQDAFWGGYSGYFADLDGHPWEIAWNPHFRLNELGEARLP
jgi:catechol 2,3-dioxygenase-like lactoylglutathione lyase family enzyme